MSTTETGKYAEPIGNLDHSIRVWSRTVDSSLQEKQVADSVMFCIKDANTLQGICRVLFSQKQKQHFKSNYKLSDLMIKK